MNDNKMDTWVVVADGGSATFFETDAEMEKLTSVAELKNGHHGANHRSGGSKDGGHHAEEARFAHDVAEQLGKDAVAHRYRALVLVAPAHFLGDLRKALPKTAEAMLSASVSRDLAGVPPHELSARLRALLADKHLDDAR